MNILMISSIYYPTIGGVTTYIDKKAEYLMKLGCNVELLCPIKEEDYKKLDMNLIKSLSYKVKFFILKNLDKNSDNIITGFLRKMSYNKANKLIFKYVVQKYLNTDTVIHQHDLISNFILIKKLKKRGYKTVLTNHTGETLLWEKLPVIGNLIINYQFKYYDKIIGPSKELAFISKKYLNKSEYFPNSIIIEEELNEFLIKDKINFFCPRRWAPTKGIKYYLEALILLKERDIELFNRGEYIFAGNEYSDYLDYKKECEELYKKINSPNLFLLGDIRDYNQMMKLYKESHFTVVPSLYEAVSLSALEAGVCGSVLLSTNVGGMPELIEDNVTGLLCESKSSEELYRIIKKSLELPEEKYKNMRLNMYQNIKNNFNYEKLMGKHIEVYKKILD